MKDAHAAGFTLSERFVFGNFALDEVLKLKDVGRTRGYEDIATGRLVVEKHGRRVLVAGPIARLYLDGRAMPADPAAYIYAVRNGETSAAYEPLPLKELPARRQRFLPLKKVNPKRRDAA